MVCLLVSLHLNITSRLHDDAVSAKDMNRRLASYAMVFVILCLYGLDTLTVAFSWSLGHYIFIGNGWNFWTVFLALVTPTTRAQCAVNIAGGICTLLADTSLVR